VITHGTDTLEETAHFLHAVLAPAKPVVLTCAMRPATALSADGPQNIADAAAVATFAGARGVVAVSAGTIIGAIDVAKEHTYRLDAFGSGDAGPVGYVEAGHLRLLRDWPATRDVRNVLDMVAKATSWPRVEIVLSHAGAGGSLVDALVAQGVRGLVVAGTGNGSIHRDLEGALRLAVAAGVKVVRSTRCPQGRILARSDDVFAGSGGLSAVKARTALMLDLLAAGA
jgi:L-asparaginase